ncbi:MAG: SdrD B-like domain-containing protein [Pseudomonas sp.]|uniref:SdrD B-like domain-containing protein n=1 Tax=Pseudomonas sp. TaxID=306 RepID=UPI003D0F55BC
MSGLIRRKRLLQALLGSVWLVGGAAHAASVDLSLTQCLTSPNPGIRGGVVTVDLNYENGSSASASAASIRIPLPATTTYVAGSASAGCAHDGATPGAVTCSFPTLPGASSGTVSLQLRTTAATGPSISSTSVFATGPADTDPNAANNQQNCSATINNGADLSAALSGPANAPGGSDITWTVSGNNAGPDAASNQIFTTTLPATLSYQSATGSGWNCATAGQTLTCTRGASLASGASYPALSFVTRLSNAVSSGNVTVSGSISSSVGDPNTANNSSSATVSVSPGADLQITQAVPLPSPVRPGEEVRFVLSARNAGPSDASDGLNVTFQLPAGFTPGTAVPSGAGWGACSWSGQLLTCPYAGSFASGRSDTITVTATAPNDPTPRLYDGANDNRATIIGGAAGPVDPLPANNTAVRSLLVSPDNAVDLAFSKAKSPNPVAVGSDITSVLRVTNEQGPYAAQAGSVTLTDVLNDNQETFVSASGPWSCAAQPNTPSAGRTSVVCTNTSAIPVRNNDTNPLVIVTRAQQAGVLTNAATVSHPGQWNPIGVIAASVTATAATNSVDLAIEKSVSTLSNTRTAPGNRITLLNTESGLTYTLVVRNNGDTTGAPIDAVDLQIRDQLPAYRSGTVVASPSAVVSTVNGSTAAFGCSVSGTGLVSCDQTGGVLKTGDTVTVNIPVSRALDAGDFTNQASVYSTSQGDPRRGDNVASADLRIQPIADLHMVSKVVTPTSLQAGTNATYTLTFRNAGPNTASSVVVKDDFILDPSAPGFTFLSASATGGGTCSGLTAGTSYTSTGRHTLTCTGFNLPAGEQRTVTVVVRPNWQAGTQGTATLVNQARVYSTTTAEDLTGVVGDIGTDASVTRGTQGNFASASVTVVNAALNALIVTNDNTPAGPDPLGFDPDNGGDNANNDIDYLVRITNQGPSLATGVRFTYDMTPPAGKTLRFTGAALAPGGANIGLCDQVGSSVTGPATLTVNCQFTGSESQLAVDASISRYLTYRVLSMPDTSGYTVSTRAQVSTNENDTNSADDIDTETTTIRVRSDIDIAVPNQGPVEVREPFDWQFNVSNNGPGTSGQTDLTSTLPADMEYISGTPITWVNATDNTSGTCSAVGQALSCDFGTVTAGAIAVVTAPVRFIRYPTGGTAQNCASATTDQIDPISGNNVSACGTVQVIKSSIAGAVFVDASNDGIFDSGESGIGNTPVRLTGNDAYGNAVDVTVQTRADGTFLFDDLNSADATGYTLIQVLPTGYFDGRDSIGDAGGSHTQNGTTDEVSAIALGRDTAATGYLFGELVSASLAGRVCVDSNDNGICEAGETGIQGVSITLSGTTVNGVDVCDVLVSCTVQTDASGAYQFTVPASDASGYTLTQQPNGSAPLNAFADGREHAGNLGGTANDNPTGSDSISAIVVAPDDRGTQYDFGETGYSLSGLVYLDGNDDGQRTADEQGIAGVTITLSGTTPDGTAICGTLLPASACTTVTEADGTYRFDGLPNGTYRVTEAQPAGYQDGRDTAGTGGGVPGGPGTDVIDNVQINGSDVSGYLFGERDGTATSASVSGKVWFESSSRDQQQNTNERGLEGWTVEARDSAGRLQASTITGADGSYRLTLLPGTYRLAFYHPVSRAVYGTPVPQDPNGAVNGTVDTATRTLTINVTGGGDIIEQNLPVDPSGVVYDAVTREPVAGAVVRIVGPGGFDPAAHLVGGVAGASQTTGPDGFYQFFLTPAAPSGTYLLDVTAPAGYLPEPSTLIPACQATLSVGNAGAPVYVQNSALAPGAGVPAHDPATCPAASGALPVGSGTTQYYLRFILGGVVDDVLNNHIPLDPVLGGAVVMTKTTPKVNVTRGELVPYTLTARNTLSSTLANVAIDDQIPPGFKYIAGSAQIEGVPTEPEVVGRRLRWPNQTLAAGQSLTVKLLLVVGSGVGFNEYVNQAWALNMLADARVSNVASATVRVVADPTFDCSDLIGKVFDDQNRNGYQDEGEPGIAGVRVATPKGWLVTTDQYGRYHIACADVPSEMRGSNFIVKVDERSLPSGYRIITENPRVVRMTQGRLVKANFGASIHRVIRLDLSDAAFSADNRLTEQYQAQLDDVLNLLHAEPSVLRIAYRLPLDGEVADARARIAYVRDWLKAHWEPHDCCYDLQVEEEIVPVGDSVEVVR